MFEDKKERLKPNGAEDAKFKKLPPRGRML